MGAALATGCAVGPDYDRPDPALPGGWAGTGAPTTRGSATSARAADVARWWTSFNDATLDSLVERAVGANFTLKQAGARVRQARASRGVTAAGYYPTLDASGDYRRTGSGGGSSDSSGTGTADTTRDNDARDLFQVGLDAAWEIDVFGGVRRGVEAADANVRAAEADRHDALVTLVSEVALNYLDLRGFQRQLAIAHGNLEVQRRSADLVRRRARGGLQSGLDVANADAQVASTASQIPGLESGARQAIYNLSVLLGRDPAALLPELTPDKPIPTTPPEVPVGLPSDLLRRRPDVRRAEAQLHAATARIGVATADLFPRFSLTGSFGLDGEDVKSLTNWSSRTWSVGPSVRWPIFDAGRIRANIQVQTAAQEEALYGYEQTVLVALRDVESALIAYAKEQQHRAALVEVVTHNRTAVDLAQRLYGQGQTDFLSVIDAQRSLYGAEDALVRSDRTIATNLVALYKALGGGWEAPAAPATRPAQ